MFSRKPPFLIFRLPYNECRPSVRLHRSLELKFLLCGKAILRLCRGFMKEFYNLHLRNKRNKMSSVKSGSLLISEPFLGDPNFERSVVLVCQHDEEGSFGLVLNQQSNLMLSDVLPIESNPYDYPLGVGGPMEHNTLHYIHRLPELPAAIQVSENLWWGGDFDVLQQMLAAAEVEPSQIRFFLGYSGWSAGQLQEELDKNLWFINNNAANKLFTLNTETLWREILKQMGGKYKMFSNYPIDPSLN